VPDAVAVAVAAAVAVAVVAVQGLITPIPHPDSPRAVELLGCGVVRRGSITEGAWWGQRLQELQLHIDVTRGCLRCDDWYRAARPAARYRYPVVAGRGWERGLLDSERPRFEEG
jgi:hypothetical protein